MNEVQKNADNYLSNIRTIQQLIRSKELELEALRYKAGGSVAIRYDKDKVQTSSMNYTEMAIIDIIELEQEIEEDKASIETVKGTAYAYVRRMIIPEQRAVIEWFYLNGLSMQDTADKMYMSERNAYYLRDDALQSFGELLN